MEMRNGLVPRSGRTHIDGTWRQFSGCDRRPETMSWAAVLLFAFLGAQAAPIQLLSVGLASPIGAQGTSADALSRSQLNESFGRLPLIFEAADVEGHRFLCRG